VYVGSSDFNVYAITSNGKQRWAFESDYFVDASPAIAEDGTIYIGSCDGKLYAVNSNGARKWAFAMGAVPGDPAVGRDGTVYAGNSDGRIYAVRPDGQLRWSYQTGATVDTHPVVGADDTVYAGSKDGYLYALRANGVLRWRYAVGGSVRAPAIGANGVIYVVSYNHVFAIGHKMYLPLVLCEPPAPVEFSYDDGTPESALMNSAGQLAAVRFTVGSQSQVVRLRYYIKGEMRQVRVAVYDASWGQVYSEAVQPTVADPQGGGWFEWDITGQGITVNGDFYVVLEWLGDGPQLGVDDDPPDHGRSYAGVLPPARIPSGNAMIRAVVR